MKLKKFIAKYDAAGNFEGKKSKERQVVYWAYTREGAKDFFNREKVSYEIIYPKS